MTAAEAFATIEREAREAGVPYNAALRDVIVASMEKTPAIIPHYLDSARRHIAERSTMAASAVELPRPVDSGQPERRRLP